MSTSQAEDPVPAVRFKRRKITHSKRVSADTDAPIAPTAQAPDSGDPLDTNSPVSEIQDGEDSVPNLKEILRNRRRPRDRQKDVARRTEEPRSELVAVDAPREGHYTKARLAEQNYRQYGWPILPHLQATVAEIAPDLKRTFTVTFSKQETPAEAQSAAEIEQSIRMAVGNGRIEEVDIGPIQKRTDEKWRRLENGEFEQIATGKLRLGRDGKPRRPPKRRNSDDIRRDQMVDAVLSEAKLDFFDAQAPTNPRFGNANNDEAILAQFEAEYYESVEEARQQQRKPTATSGVKGAPEAPKGPKLGGSKSVRAKMRLAQEQAAKAKR
ncbi:hypothetical protein EK21DRAFT_102661 [Setomelanomma holmii]|uniref:Uncharacterized protein n=1 Tax=Setomelanomma holmii TaxID=210430 RepID=A0A9P4LJG7_9PLEO|nr:hypothetical protein EK21DRAFT_102661 [Setomelanomma holmii]